jgi:hypothetical protein
MVGLGFGSSPSSLKFFGSTLFVKTSRGNLIHLQVRDNRIWGVDNYMVKEGYIALLQQTTLPEKSNIWRNIWNKYGLPKINIFCWILAHGKLLTGENLNKRGFQGPFRCALCLQSL